MKTIQTLFFFLLLVCKSFSQDQHLLDSLESQLKEFEGHKLEMHGKNPEQNDTIKVNLLFELSKTYWYSDFDKGIEYANKSLQLAEQINFKKGYVHAYYTMGVINFIKGNYPLGLEQSKKSLSIAEEINDKQGIADAYINIGNISVAYGNYAEGFRYYYASLKIAEQIGWKMGVVYNYTNLGNIYARQGNYPQALKYYFASLKIKKKIGDKLNMASDYSNIASIYTDQGKYPEALKYFAEALKINEEVGNKVWESSDYGSIGRVYVNQGRYSEGLKNFFVAFKMATEYGDKVGAAIWNGNIGYCYMMLKNYPEARKYLNNSLASAKELGLKECIKTNYDDLAELDSATGNWKSAYENHKLFVLYRDSLVNEENTKKIVQVTMQKEFDKKEIATKSEQEKKDIVQRNIRNSITGGLAGALVFLVIVFRQRNKVKKEKLKAEAEKQKAEIAKKQSEELLLNILPAEVAEELKNTGTAKAKAFTLVTVMFTDFKDFTGVSEKVSAELLVDEIHHCFSAFDNIIQKHKIEKIKTIGDAYLCASGLPVSNYTHAVDMINAAFEIRNFMLQRKIEKEAIGEIPFELRIGIHTGPVVAGIVGIKKYAYDIWGDTVNLAARMEQNSSAGKINISGSTYELVKTKFTCEHRGKIEAKNKGEIDMYFVEP